MCDDPKPNFPWRKTDRVFVALRAELQRWLNVFPQRSGSSFLPTLHSLTQIYNFHSYENARNFTRPKKQRGQGFLFTLFTDLSHMPRQCHTHARHPTNEWELYCMSAFVSLASQPSLPTSRSAPATAVICLFSVSSTSPVTHPTLSWRCSNSDKSSVLFPGLVETVHPKTWAWDQESSLRLAHYVLKSKLTKSLLTWLPKSLSDPPLPPAEKPSVASECS